MGYEKTAFIGIVLISIGWILLYQKVVGKQWIIAWNQTVNANLSSWISKHVNLNQDLGIENVTSVFVNITTHKQVELLKVETTSLEPCPSKPPNLSGKITINPNSVTWEDLNKKYPMLEPGGRYKPTECVSRNRVAIVIPYRDREEHLRIFLNNIHSFLQNQQLDYGIYVIEMAADITFNRALLMNIGFTEASKHYQYDCFIFHDVDLIPEDDRNIYSCPSQPRHMSVAVSTFQYKLPYETLFGGVSALTKEQFVKVNGFSNLFFGWGGEDDDMSIRLTKHGLNITRYSPQIARYKMLKHMKEKPSSIRGNLLGQSEKRIQKADDGLNSLNYTILKQEHKQVFSWTLVSVDKNKIQSYTNGKGSHSVKARLVKA